MTEKIIIDAYNFIHAAKRAGRAPFKSVQDAVYALERYGSLTSKEVTVVFDGTRYEGQWGSSRYLKILCSEPGEKADSVAERLMGTIPPSERLRWMLVSDDTALRDMAVGSGLRVVNCGLFLDEMQARIKSGIEKKPPSRRPFNTPFNEKL